MDDFMAQATNHLGQGIIPAALASYRRVVTRRYSYVRLDVAVKGSEKGCDGLFTMNRRYLFMRTKINGDTYRKLVISAQPSRKADERATYNRMSSCATDS